MILSSKYCKLFLKFRLEEKKLETKFTRQKTNYSLLCENLFFIISSVLDLEPLI